MSIAKRSISAKLHTASMANVSSYPAGFGFSLITSSDFLLHM